MREISLDDCIRFLAKQGASKNSVAKVLDIRFEDFLEMCKLVPDAEWAPKGQTIGDIQARRKRKRSYDRAKKDSFKPVFVGSLTHN